MVLARTARVAVLENRMFTLSCYGRYGPESEDVRYPKN